MEIDVKILFILLVALIVVHVCSAAKSRGQGIDRRPENASVQASAPESNPAASADDEQSPNLDPFLSRIYDEGLMHLDAEDLAEAGMLTAFNYHEEALKKYLTNTEKITERFNDGNSIYHVTADGQEYKIYDEEMRTAEMWWRAAWVFSQIINKRLVKEESPYTFYLLYAGNDLSGVFLKPEEYALFLDKTKPNEQPYLAELDKPWGLLPHWEWSLP